jgi:hypothetical protein
MRSKTFVGGVVGIGTLVGGLCGCEMKLDPKKIDEIITGMFKQASLEVATIDCPKNQKAKKGEVFECEVTVKPSVKVPVTVEVTDNSGTVNVKTKFKVITPAKLAKEIEGKLGGQGVSATVDCGTEVRVAMPGTTFSCTASSGAEKRTLAVSVDDKGEASWKLEGGAAPAGN